MINPDDTGDADGMVAQMHEIIDYIRDAPDENDAFFIIITGDREKRRIMSYNAVPTRVLKELVAVVEAVGASVEPSRTLN